MTTELATRPTQTNEIDVAQLLTAIVQHGVTSDAAGAVKELVLLREHQEDRDAQRQWLGAFAEVRNATKTINAGKGIPAKDGSIKWFYAPLEDLLDAIEPILQMHGMTLRFDSRREGNLCHGICWVSHFAGHEKKSECAVNTVGAQGGDLGAIKIAKRGAMTAMFGIKTRHMDDDASVLGDVVTAEQAAHLKKRATELGPELHERFLTYIEKTCQTRDFANIRQGKFGAMDDALTRAERKKRDGKPTPAPAKIERIDETPSAFATGLVEVQRQAEEAREAKAPNAQSLIEVAHAYHDEDQSGPTDHDRVSTLDGFMCAMEETAMTSNVTPDALAKFIDTRAMRAGKKGKLKDTTVAWRLQMLVDLRNGKLD